MNPLKCAFGVSSRQFIGFVVRHRGIKLVFNKIIVIFKMPRPRNISELKRLQDRLTYIHQFISNILGCYQPFSRLMKKGVPFV